MAHRIITTVIITGARVFGRAFTEAWKQASAAQRYAQASKANGGSGSSNAFASSGLTLDEACKILNVPPPKGGKVDLESVLERFKRLFDMNDPEKGGSFYLQSKILRARERIEMEVREAAEKEQFKKDAEKPFPDVYKNR